jgi:predicted acyl esterase
MSGDGLSGEISTAIAATEFSVPPNNVGERPSRGIRGERTEPISCLIPMTDGRALTAYRYPSSRGHAAAVVLFTPYRKESWWLETHVQATLDEYEVFVVDVRGFGESSGQYAGPLSPGEIDDAVQALGWIAQQPFCNGSTALIGSSYSGAIQWHIAARHPPSLRCIAPSIAFLDRYRDMAHRGGIPASTAWAASTYANAGNPATARAGLLQAVEDFLDPFDGPRWRTESARELLGLVDTPALCIGGLYDVFTESTLTAFLSVEGPARLVLGPWGHQTDVSESERGELSRWLAYWLRGQGADPTSLGERVRVYRSGDEHWMDLGEWPSVDESRWRSWSPVKSEVGLTVEALLDAVAPPTSLSPTEPSIDVGLDSGMRTWSEEWTARTTFNDEATVILGVVMLRAWLMSDRGADLDIHCRLSLVRANGAVEQLTESRLRASHRLIDRARSVVRSDGELVVPWRPHQTLLPVPAGKPFELEIAFPPIHVAVDAGEAIQLGLTVVQPGANVNAGRVTLLPSSRLHLPACSLND